MDMMAAALSAGLAGICRRGRNTRSAPSRQSGLRRGSRIEPSPALGYFAGLMALTLYRD
jgi:hypothetical protein